MVLHGCISSLRSPNGFDKVQRYCLFFGNKNQENQGWTSPIEHDKLDFTSSKIVKWTVMKSSLANSRGWPWSFHVSWSSCIKTSVYSYSWTKWGFCPNGRSWATLSVTASVMSNSLKRVAFCSLRLTCWKTRNEIFWDYNPVNQDSYWT